MKLIKYFTIIILFLCASCRIVPEKRDVKDDLILPYKYLNASEIPSDKKDDSIEWWKSFENPELNRFVTESLSENYDIEASYARLAQAQTRVSQTQSALFPYLNFSSSIATVKQRSLRTTGEYTTTSTKNYEIGLVAGYEIDLWRKINSQYKASLLSKNATAEALQITAITVSAETTLSWIRIITQKRLAALIKQQKNVNRQYLLLVEKRFKQSMTSAMDIYNQKQISAGIAKQLPLIESQEETYKNRLAILIASEPSEISVKTKKLPKLPPLPPVGIPIELLTSRPDIKNAWLQLCSSDLDIAIAKADRLPSLTISGSAKNSAAKWENLLKGWYTNLATGIIAPLFDAGRRKAVVEQKRAVAKEKLSIYKKIVLNAIVEVNNALIREKKQENYLHILKKQLEAADNALYEAKNRYKKGLNDYLYVLNALQAIYKIENEIIIAENNLFEHRISLYRALAGKILTTNK
ncbi:MAG: efflux transporter outer membrane subunit [Verrucomicrobiota bacterium]|nr:efflux transporter outer membrane subunit [Verrucomicrobiota bacterium]